MIGRICVDKENSWVSQSGECFMQGAHMQRPLSRKKNKSLPGNRRMSSITHETFRGGLARSAQPFNL